MTILHRFKPLAIGSLLALTLAAPAVAQNWTPMRTQRAWHINMTARQGTLVGLSPVAAKIQFDDGRQRVFSVSHGQYERLRGDVGSTISFDVRHGVLHATTA